MSMELMASTSSVAPMLSTSGIAARRFALRPMSPRSEPAVRHEDAGGARTVGLVRNSPARPNSAGSQRADLEIQDFGIAGGYPAVWVMDFPVTAIVHDPEPDVIYYRRPVLRSGRITAPAPRGAREATAGHAPLATQIFPTSA